MVAPFAAASDPFAEQLCVDDDACFGAGTCVDAVCVPRNCQPVIECRGDVGPDTLGCAVNSTIDGRTCQAFVSVGAGDDRDITLPGWGDASGTDVEAAVSVTNGSVYAYNLPNTWLSPAAQIDVTALGIDAGTFSVALYRSDIITEGPRGGPYGAIAPSENHTWTEIAFIVRHDGGPTGGEGVVAAVWLLDLMPDGCFVRGLDGADDVRCPRLPHIIP